MDAMLTTSDTDLVTSYESDTDGSLELITHSHQSLIVKTMDCSRTITRQNVGLDNFGLGFCAIAGSLLIGRSSDDIAIAYGP